jgi:uncharacterized protein (TIGR00255 family)
MAVRGLVGLERRGYSPTTFRKAQEESLTVASMTGFARSEGFKDGYSWAWEIRSVNARGLDVRAKLPPGHESLEMKARARVAETFKRGSISIALNLARPERAARIKVNRDVLNQVVGLARELAHEVNAPPPQVEGLLSLHGVLERIEDEETEEARAGREAAMAETLDSALGELSAARGAEGTKLETMVSAHLGRIADLAAAAEKSASAQPDALKRRVREQVAALLEAKPDLPEERLAQEAALLASRADVREELDRLTAHVAAARELLAEGGAVGRRFDFLCQEFNREANTLCSKSTDIELTRVGLDLKAAIEQLREQVQNIE